MKFFKTAFVLAMAVSTVATAGTFIDIHRGYDSVGGDYKAYRTNNQNDCANLCAQESACVAMEFNYRTNLCHLKNSMNPIKVQPDGILGLKTLDLINWKDFNGGDYRIIENSDAFTCSQQCVLESQCKVFTFNTETKLCHLKDTVNRQSGNYYGISGVK